MTGVDYESITRAARNSAYLEIVRTVLRAHQSLGRGRVPEGHAFNISLDLTMPGIIFPSQFSDRNELTITLQHQFANLRVFPELFEVLLTFNSVPHFMSVPFDAVRVFDDPGGPIRLFIEKPNPSARVEYRSPEFYEIRNRLVASLPRASDPPNVIRPAFGRRRPDPKPEIPCL